MDDAYQVFDNGDLAGQFGEVTGSMPKVYSTHSRMFPLAQPGRHDAEAGQGSASPDSRGKRGRICSADVGSGLLALDGA